MKYISERDLFKALASECKYTTRSCDNCRNKCDLYTIISYQKDIVRCMTCKHRGNSLTCKLESEGMYMPDFWFCADGERKDG